MPALIARVWRMLLLAAVLVPSIAVAATPAGTTITNTAQVRWGVGAGTLTASSQVQVTVSPYALGPDLTLSMAGPAQAAPGSNIVWRVVVSDVGPAAAAGAQVTVNVPPGVTGISATCAVLVSGTCGVVTVGASTPAGTLVTITLPSLPVGGSVEITLRGTAPAAAGTLNTLAQASVPPLIDPTPTNNVATVQTQVLAGAPNTGSLSGHVWLDTNHDRLRGSSELPFQGFMIRVYDAAGTTLVRQVATDASGAYTFAGLPAGVSYQLEFRDAAGTVVYGLPVSAETGGAGFASALSCVSMPETNAPNVVSPIQGGTCYSLTTGGSSSAVQRNGRILIQLQPGDNVIEQSLPLDPSGVVYDSVTRQPIAGATVTFNGPAGFDAALHLLGGAANLSQLTGATGFYQFLLINGAPAGSYTLTVTPPAGYTSPSAQIPASPALDPSGLGVGGVFPVQAQAGPPTGAQPTTYHLAFVLAAGDPDVINNHIPLDPAAASIGLVLQKTASKNVAAVGDFVQYQLTLFNPGVAVPGVSVSDRLPPGLRYRAGTTRINNAAAPDPVIAADGRTLTFTIGAVATGATFQIRYVVEVAAGAAVGDAINTAQASGAAGLVRSLVASATVTVKEDLFKSRTVLLGRVIEVGEPVKVAATGQVQAAPKELCGPERLFGKGLEGARIYLEDGTTVRTDKDGKWHVDGVKPGTHVVQLDVKSLPDGYEAVLCEDNTRHAGRAFSQFVNVQGGTLWRADFYVRNTGKSGAAEYEAGQRVSLTRSGDGVRVKLEVKGRTAGVRNISATVALPAGLTYAAGSARVNGQAMAEPEASDSMAVFRMGDAKGDWNKTIEFNVTGILAADAAVRAITQFQSADGETRRLPPVSVALDTVSSAVSKSEIIQYKQILTNTPAAPAAEAPAGKSAAEQAKPGYLNIYAPGSEQFDANWLATTTAGFEIVYPPADFIPGINATKIYVKHEPGHKVTVSVNGVPVHALNFDGNDQNIAKNIAISRWGGAMIKDGANKITAVATDESGKEVARAERVLHYSGSAVEGRFVAGASTLIADGNTAPVIAVRIFDRDGKPARHGTDGPLQISAPYQSFEVAQRRDGRPLLDDVGNVAKWRVTEDGIALIRLQPTTQSGEVVLTFNFPGRPPQLIRAWLKPEMREWILVGFGEGTIGQRKLSGGIENLPQGDADEKLWKDGRVAFYAKGQVTGDFLLTVAYDTDKERRRTTGNAGARLNQMIDRKQYYTIYGDTTSPQHDAASVRKLYIKIEKEQFYALFGDFDTGLSVTELSRYSRTLNGVKSEFRGENVSYSAFATKTAQAFVKDELRPDGTSGLYRLTRRGIVPNSDKVMVETRDRFRNEVIIKSEPMSRGIDYEIDHTQGTLFFRRAIPGKDQNFNPIYIIAEYESEDTARDERVTAGGRVAVRTSDGKAEVGVTAIHEGTRGARGDLAGVDATVQIDDKTKLRAEYAESKREFAGANLAGSAYLVEVRRQDANVAATAYVRGQEGGFGLGQQAAAQAGTNKVGGDVSVKLTETLRLNAQAIHERIDNAGAQADRSLLEGRINYVQPDYSLYGGGRLVRDHSATGETLTSNQVVAGGSYKLMDGRLNLRVDAELTAGGNNASTDYPHRLRLGADYKISDTMSLFADQEFAYGARENAGTTRLGVRSKPWEGAESASSVNLGMTPHGPSLSTSSSMTQTLKLSDQLTLNAGMDRTSTLRKPGNAPLNANAPSAQGVTALGGAASQSIAPISPGYTAAPVEDYTSVFAGATWNHGPWGASLRGEWRHGDTFDRLNLSANLHRDLKEGEALAATALYTGTTGAVEGDTRSLDLRLSYAYRPVDSRLIVLNRLDYIQQESENTGGQGSATSRKLVNNFNANYQVDRSTQFALQYGAKYVFDSFDGVSASGYTDLIGFEARRDLGKRFDIGARASVLHSWGSKTYTPSYGASVGFSPVTNMWVGVGYNVAGFRDNDFSGANATAKGWYLFFRFKADQGVKDTATQRKLMFEEVAR